MGELLALFSPEFSSARPERIRYFEIKQIVLCPDYKPAPAFGGLMVRTLAKPLYRRAPCTTTILLDFLLKLLDCGERFLRCVGRFTSFPESQRKPGHSEIN